MAGEFTPRAWPSESASGTARTGQAGRVSDGVLQDWGAAEGLTQRGRSLYHAIWRNDASRATGIDFPS